MTNIYILICFFVLFCSCSRNITKENDNHNIIVSDSIDIADNQRAIPTPKEENINLDSIKQEILALKEKFHLSVLDTIKYQFSLDDVGTEGNEGFAYYLNDSVKKIQIDIYTSMWKYDLFYFFDKPYIKVTERTYDIANVYSGGDIELIKTLSYTMDKNGVPYARTDSNRIDIFQEIRQAIPFILK